MQRLTDVPLTFRHADGVGDATDVLGGQLLDATPAERDGRQDGFERLARLRHGLPAEAQAVLDGLPPVREEGVDDRVVSFRLLDWEWGGTGSEPHERRIDAGLGEERVACHPLQGLARGATAEPGSRPRAL